MKIACRIVAALISACWLLGIPSPAGAIFANSGDRIPMKRLLANVARFVKENPADARGHYTLARLHSIAFAGDQEEAYVVLRDHKRNTPLKLPEFGVTSVRVSPNQETSRLTPEQREHLRLSLREYARATELAPDQPLFWLGRGWMLEQAARFTPNGPTASPDSKSGKASGRSHQKRDVPDHSLPQLLKKALAAYRQAFRLSAEADMAKESISANGDDDAVSDEAGAGIIRLLSKRNLSMAEKRELRRVELHVAAIKKKPHWITPVIFGGKRSRLSDLLSPVRTVRFDLAGTGEREQWPWVRPGVGILVWDPLRMGRITSGRQLFGSRTWQMRWRNGYEPLASLDDNGDGELTGGELRGISVWYDRNGNAVSEPGEVVTTESSGLAAISVRPDKRVGGVPGASSGIRMRDGQVIPTFDWTPRSLPTNRLKR
jgi:hypothetical protein